MNDPEMTRKTESREIVNVGSEFREEGFGANMVSVQPPYVAPIAYQTLAPVPDFRLSLGAMFTHANSSREVNLRGLRCFGYVEKWSQSRESNPIRKQTVSP